MAEFFYSNVWPLPVIALCIFFFMVVFIAAFYKR